jgi:hypothetical protein
VQKNFKKSCPLKKDSASIDSFDCGFVENIILTAAILPDKKNSPATCSLPFLN